MNGEREPFDSRLSALENLTKLAIGEGRSYCWVTNFTKSYFDGLPNLETIVLDSCTPDNYSSSMFAANSNLTDLSIVRDRRDIKTIFPVLCYLPNPAQVRSVEISHTIKDEQSPPIVLTSDEVECISKMTNLVYLNLEHNEISQLTRKFLMRLPPSLKTLSVRSNVLFSFHSVVYQLLASILPNLKNLYEDFQGLYYYHDEGREIVHQKQSEALGLDHHATDTSAELCSALAQKKLLIARKNSETKSDSTKRFVASNHPSYSINMDKYTAIRSVNLGKLFFQPIKKNKPIHIGTLNLSSTLITDWGIDSVMFMPPDIIIADLSENRCENFNATFFMGNNSLVEFHARGNFLGLLLSKDSNGSLFSRLTNLEYLDLSRNHLHTLPWLLFQGMPRLRVLKLRLNDIDVVDIHIAHMTSLVFLDLARNSISSISKRTRRELDYLASKGHIYVDLTFNPLPCTCEGFELLKWMSETQVHILNKDILLCFDGNQQKEFVGNLPNRIIDLKRECITKRLLIMACSFAFAILLLLTGFIFVFQKRWWIIYMRNRAISHFLGHRKSHKKPASPYTFDAFFVYSATRSDFVLDECLEELEAKRGHRLCVEDRDFLAGLYVPCNITSAVRSSRTTVVVLDEHFRAEGWVQYAVEMAQVEAVRSKRDVLHLLFVGSPPDGCLPGAYLKVLRQGRFSEVPPKECPPDVREKFWGTFSRLLGHTDQRNDMPQSRLEIDD